MSARNAKALERVAYLLTLAWAEAKNETKGYPELLRSLEELAHRVDQAREKEEEA